MVMNPEDAKKQRLSACSLNPDEVFGGREAQDYQEKIIGMAMEAFTEIGREPVRKQCIVSAPIGFIDTRVGCFTHVMVDGMEVLFTGYPLNLKADGSAENIRLPEGKWDEALYASFQYTSHHPDVHVGGSRETGTLTLTRVVTADQIALRLEKFSRNAAVLLLEKGIYETEVLTGRFAEMLKAVSRGESPDRFIAESEHLLDAFQ